MTYLHGQQALVGMSHQSTKATGVNISANISAARNAVISAPRYVSGQAALPRYTPRDNVQCRTRVCVPLPHVMVNAGGQSNESFPSTRYVSGQVRPLQSSRGGVESRHAERKSQPLHGGSPKGGRLDSSLLASEAGPEWVGGIPDESWQAGVAPGPREASPSCVVSCAGILSRQADTQRDLTARLSASGNADQFAATSSNAASAPTRNSPLPKISMCLSMRSGSALSCVISMRPRERSKLKSNAALCRALHDCAAEISAGLGRGYSRTRPQRNWQPASVTSLCAPRNMNFPAIESLRPSPSPLSSMRYRDSRAAMRQSSRQPRGWSVATSGRKAIIHLDNPTRGCRSPERRVVKFNGSENLPTSRAKSTGKTGEGNG